ncbi:MAG: hypothetical protein LBE91_18490 [Tannerella sp.]|nr:hypothetical protein [Tannerella sp.]
MQFNGFWGSDAAEYYVPKAEIASYALGNTAYSIRLTNPFPTAGGEGAVPDEYGIYSGLPEIWPEEIVRDNVQMIINIDRADGKARIAQTGIGAMWYDIEMFIMLNGATSAGTVRSDAAGNIVSIDFPAESLFIVALSPNQGWRGGLQLYLSWDTYIADHMQIEDFNVLDYEDIPGAVSEFESKAYGESWNQAIAKAVDVDEENPDSEYKDLYYLPDLYAAGYGLAFYYDGTALSIPANQPIGTTAFQNKLFVSQSSSIKSSVTVSPKGVTIYTLGLQFHYADGTVVGEFAEAFYYSEDPVSYDIADFYGRFKLTGPSQFSGEEDANMNVTIAAGSEENTLIIKGITYAAEVEAVFDPGTSTMSIAPQVLADFILQGNAYDMTLYTTTPDGDISETATMDFTFNMAGELVMTPTSGADGYLINSDAAGGWVDGYYGLLFTPQAAASSAVVKSSAYNNTPLKAMKSLQRTSVVKKEKGSNGNFIIQKKASRKAVGNMVPAPVF